MPASYLLEGLLHEDERDQGGKVLLREPGDVAHEGAGVRGHHDEQQDADPDPDAEAKG